MVYAVEQTHLLKRRGAQGPRQSSGSRYVSKEKAHKKQQVTCESCDINSLAVIARCHESCVYLWCTLDQPLTNPILCILCAILRPRDRFKQAFDSYCGLCIVALYFLYLGVVRGALGVFDCTQSKDGRYILDADPSIVCNEVH
jgi:hypothetical protein